MVLRLDSVSKEYQQDKRKIQALKNLDFSIDKGDFVNIIGKSGSGKSTLLNIVAGLLSPSSGKVYFDNNDIYSLPDKKICQIRNRDIGYIAQGSASIQSLSVLENVMLPLCLYKNDLDVKGKAMYALKRLEIESLANSYPSQLSGGEERRMLIARAIINSPRLIIADEPCSDLDVINTKNVMEIFKSLNTEENMSILMVSHDLDTLKYGNRIYTMVSGELQEGNQLI